MPFKTVGELGQGGRPGFRIMLAMISRDRAVRQATVFQTSPVDATC
jgi:hypothetical protein